MNIDYLFLAAAALDATSFPFFQPDGLGMSIFITAPGPALRGPRAVARVAGRGGSPARRSLVLIPTLLYYGGGWLQYGYRYALDSIPFVWALCAMAAASDEARTRRRDRGAGDRRRLALLIVFGVLVGLLGCVLGLPPLTRLPFVAERAGQPPAWDTPARAPSPTPPGDLRPVRSRRAHVRGRLVQAARPRLREHDPGGGDDPDRVLRRDGDRQRRRRAVRRPGALPASAVRRDRARPGRRRPRSRRSPSGCSTRSIAGRIGALETTPEALALVRFGLAVLALAPATVLMGATLPTLTRELTRRRASLEGFWPACTRPTRSARSSGRSRPGWS